MDISVSKVVRGKLCTETQNFQCTNHYEYKILY